MRQSLGPMSVKYMDWVWSHRESFKLSGPDTSTLLKLAGLTENMKTPVVVSIQTLSKNTGYCERTVYRSLQSLLAKNLIVKINRDPYHPHFRWDWPVRLNAYKINVKAFCHAEKERNYELYP